MNKKIFFNLFIIFILVASTNTNAKNLPATYKQYNTAVQPAQTSMPIQNDVRGITNQVAFQSEQKLKATKALFSDTFINGDSATDSKAFDGLDKALIGTSTEFNTTTAIDLFNPLYSIWRGFSQGNSRRVKPLLRALYTV